MNESTLDNDRLTLPAEWETQQAVQLTWPHEDTDWKPILKEITDTYIQIALEIARHEDVIIVSPCTDDAKKAIYPKATIDQWHNIYTLECDTNDTWARDHAFISLVGDDHNVLLDFRFNGWGDKFAADKDNAINRHLYQAGMIEGKYVDHLDFVLEGGSIESDGRGTVFTTTNCLMAPSRNQPLSKDDIEERLKQMLHAKRIMWIDHGNLTGDDTDGHIDTMVRTAPDDTLLYIGCDDTADEQYEELTLMEEQIKTFKTLEGHPYRLIKLPMPRPIYNDGERLPATYANFLVINGAVLYPTYNQPDLDSKAESIISTAFPDREMIGIDCRNIIIQHGSLHCCTMQYPEKRNNNRI